MVRWGCSTHSFLSFCVFAFLRFLRLFVFFALGVKAGALTVKDCIGGVDGCLVYATTDSGFIHNDRQLLINLPV